MKSLVLALRAVFIFSLLVFVDEVIIYIGNLLEENGNWNWDLNLSVSNKFKPVPYHVIQAEQKKRMQVCEFCLFYSFRHLSMSY